MPPQLTETEIDDLIYLSRTNELADFESELKTLAAREGCVIKDIVLAARDEMSGNGCLHMAAANGHVGSSSLVPLSISSVCGVVGGGWL